MYISFYSHPALLFFETCPIHYHMLVHLLLIQVSQKSNGSSSDTRAIYRILKYFFIHF